MDAIHWGIMHGSDEKCLLTRLISNLLTLLEHPKLPKLQAQPN